MASAVHDLVPAARRTPVDAGVLLDRTDADLDALADRLHDGVLQSLVVARYACDAVARGADPSVARDAVQEALVALRRQVWELRPRTAHGLGAALVELAAHRSQAGLPALELDLDDVDVAPAAAAVAYRLVQSLPDDRPLAVRLAGSGPVLVVGAAVADPAGWALRLRAVGADLILDATHTRVLLPPLTPDDREHP